ncbi:hypothetical protein AAX16_04505 [Haemophilus haemolyticus]|nr:hypothetical protein AAX16_04505 [Haemophilus haemolyticus]
MLILAVDFLFVLLINIITNTSYFLFGYIKYKAYYSLLVFLIFVFFFYWICEAFFVKFDIL